MASSALNLQNTFWSTTGNSGLNASTNYMGTNSDVDVVFQRYGVQSGLLNDSKSNTSWGVGALNASATGGNNTATGTYALSAVTSGFSNTAMGSSALTQLTTGVDNVGIGGGALFALTTGSDNTALGYTTLYKITTGQSNTAVGSQALFNNRADENTGIGFWSLYYNTTGANNTATGVLSLFRNITGDNNTAMGYSALQRSGTGSSNTAVGFEALQQDTVGSGNTGVGYWALLTDSSGSYNTAIGYQADVAVKTLTNATAIGAYAYPAASNTVVIGGIDGINGGTSVNVGIGTNAPTERLEVVGNTKTTNLQMTSGAANGYILKSDATGNASWVTPASVDVNIYNTNGTLTGNRTVTMSSNTLNFTGGNVGIGTAIPTATMDVTGDIHASTYLRGDAQSFLFANGNTAGSNNVVLRKDASNAYIWPWGTGTSSNTIFVGGGSNTNMKVSGTFDVGSWANQSLATNGYTKMGAMIIQWGTASYTSNTPATITFPTAFTSAANVFSLTATVDAGANTGSGNNAPVKVMTITATTFQIAGQASFSGDAVSKIRWIAIGQ